jgi:predicted small secreted protein
MEHDLTKAALSLFALLTLSACNTVYGVGKDVTAAGNTLSGTAANVQSDM